MEEAQVILNAIMGRYNEIDHRCRLGGGFMGAVELRPRGWQAMLDSEKTGTCWSRSSPTCTTRMATHDWLTAGAMKYVMVGFGTPGVLTMHSTEYGRDGNVFYDGFPARSATPSAPVATPPRR